ncbi:uncharacterized protein LOC110091911 [Dendrobium catenatum]|uniref:Tic22-like family protein n=1 Tax=Dendrobium catenatum TaxID=906689 RepID=A0A2I0XDE7_9ASPA|nr:uncharacterized protein LOC110091911 [Dendrobium catenatum]PKU85923.1 hypothetical protein MA16_Dca001754 [Dendrobium catenatum]
MMPCNSSSSERNTPLSLQSAGRCVQSLTSNILSRLPFSTLVPGCTATPSKIITPPPLPLVSFVTVPVLLPSTSSSLFYSPGRSQNQAAPPSSVRSLSSSVRVDGLGSSGKGGGGGGPAFVGQVFSMLDPSGNGLMAVTSHFDIPFITKRLPEWVKKLVVRVGKNEENGPVFRFFMDLSDAVTYVKRMNVPTGMVGACRLDAAYEHFKEKPHMFQFVPNKEQVKAANKLLRTIPKKGERRKVHGVPVFTANNLNIAIATADGIKWYTPYFFDKNLLDNILEASIDQHFHTLIHSRHMQRRRDIVDDGFAAEIEEHIDSLFEPPEVQELLDEMGHPGVPLSVMSKAAEIQLLDVVDKALLGNKWLRKVTGIQPKLPYLVDSFEERSAACFQKNSALASSATNPQILQHNEDRLNPFASDTDSIESTKGDNAQPISQMNYQFPFGDWLSNPWSRLQGKQHKSKGNISNPRMMKSDENDINKVPPNPLLPKITMVGVSMGEGGQMNRANLKKTMEDLTKELEQASQASGNSSKDKDPLFVANVGDYSSITRISSA